MYYCITRKDWVWCLQLSDECKLNDWGRFFLLSDECGKVYEARNTCFICQRHVTTACSIMFDSLDTLMIKDLLGIVAYYMKVISTKNT